MAFELALSLSHPLSAVTLSWSAGSSVAKTLWNALRSHLAWTPDPICHYKDAVADAKHPLWIEGLKLLNKSTLALRDICLPSTQLLSILAQPPVCIACSMIRRALAIADPSRARSS
jgi:hypothetical protein